MQARDHVVGHGGPADTGKVSAVLIDRKSSGFACLQRPKETYVAHVSLKFSALATALLGNRAGAKGGRSSLTSEELVDGIGGGAQNYRISTL